MRSVSAWFFALIVLAAGGRSAAQKARSAPLQTRTIACVQDNTLYESSTGSLSNGAGDHIFAGSTATGEIRRALLAFDVAGSIPSGARILGATLTLHVTRTIAGPEDVSLHRLLAAWGEGTSHAFGQEGAGAPATPGDATWIHTFYPGLFWALPGGDYAGTASATTSVGFTGPFTWTSTRVVADVQEWLDAPAANFGWIVIGQEQGIATTKRFGSRNGTPVLRPTLTITYCRPQGACRFPAGVLPFRIPRGFGLSMGLRDS